MDELAAAEAPKTKRQRGGGRKVWRLGKAYLYPGNLLHKRFAHYTHCDGKMCLYVNANACLHLRCPSNPSVSVDLISGVGPCLV